MSTQVESARLTKEGVREVFAQGVLGGLGREDESLAADVRRHESRGRRDGCEDDDELHLNRTPKELKVKGGGRRVSLQWIELLNVIW